MFAFQAGGSPAVQQLLQSNNVLAEGASSGRMDKARPLLPKPPPPAHAFCIPAPYPSRIAFGWILCSLAAFGANYSAHAEGCLVREEWHPVYFPSSRPLAGSLTVYTTMGGEF